MTRGLLYVAFSKNFDALAAHAITYSRQYTDLPVHILTNLTATQRSDEWRKHYDVTFTEFDLPDNLNREVKTSMIQHTPFDQTLYLDSDSVIQNPGIEAVFTWLRPGALVLNRRLTWPMGDAPALYVKAMRMFAQTLPLVAWNGAFIGFNKNDAKVQAFFLRWHSYWRRFGSGREMPPLCCAIAAEQKTGLQVVAAIPDFFAPQHENNNAVVQHEYPYIRERCTVAFTTKFNLPIWPLKQPHDIKGQWTRIMPSDPLPTYLVTSPTDPYHRNLAPSDETLCVITYVYGAYADYIPLYIYSILTSYPGYYVRILLGQTLTNKQQNALKLIRETCSTRFDIVENFSVSPKLDHYKHTRWFLPEHIFAPFRYAYIGDIDFIIVKEDPDILTHHLNQCAKTKMPYSNAERWQYPRRMSGLHFIDVPNYYHKMHKVISRCLDTLATPLDPTTNEYLLYTMLAEAGIAPVCAPGTRDQFDVIRPHHGLHLGLLRGHTQPKEYKTIWQH